MNELTQNIFTVIEGRTFDFEKVKEWETKCGVKATVCSVVPSPTISTFPVIGYIKIGSSYQTASWSKSGRYGHIKHEPQFDLLKPWEKTYEI